MRLLIGWIIMKTRVFYKWILVRIKHLLKWLKKVRLEVLILKTFILVLDMERIWSVEKYWSEILFFRLLCWQCHKYCVKCGTSLRFWENKGLIIKIDWTITKLWLASIVSRFRGKLVKMIKDTGSKFDDYSVSPKIRQILLHWGYELTEK